MSSKQGGRSQPRPDVTSLLISDNGFFTLQLVFGIKSQFIIKVVSFMQFKKSHIFPIFFPDAIFSGFNF